MIARRLPSRPAARLCAVLVGVASTSSVASAATCVAPTPPPIASRPQAPAKPPRPDCIAETSTATRCPDGDIDRYNATVTTYNNQRRAYSREAARYAARLQDYLEAARQYTVCETAGL